MDLGIVSMRYAKALLRFALENGEAEKVYAETSALAQAFLSVPGLQHAMVNPVLSDRAKEQLLLTAACAEAGPSASLARFVALVVRKQRADLMSFVAHSYGSVYRKHNHIIRGKLVVPTAVDDRIVKKLQGMLESKSRCQIDFQVIEDASIEGGFVLEYDTYRLDASVRTQIAKLKRELI